jgi:hypothetical protein
VSHFGGGFQIGYVISGTFWASVFTPPTVVLRLSV